MRDVASSRCSLNDSVSFVTLWGAFLVVVYSFIPSKYLSLYIYKFTCGFTLNIHLRNRIEMTVALCDYYLYTRCN